MFQRSVFRKWFGVWRRHSLKEIADIVTSRARNAARASRYHKRHREEAKTAVSVIETHNSQGLTPTLKEIADEYSSGYYIDGNFYNRDLAVPRAGAPAFLGPLPREAPNPPEVQNNSPALQCRTPSDAQATLQGAAGRIASRNNRSTVTSSAPDTQNNTPDPETLHSNQLTVRSLSHPSSGASSSNQGERGGSLSTAVR
jgi:hypothetical protein